MFRTLIAVASSYQLKISQMNFMNAFLNGDLNEEVYMTSPHGVPLQNTNIHNHIYLIIRIIT